MIILPEMPEVESIRRDLIGRLVGQQICDIDVALPRLIKWPTATIFQAMLIGSRITDLKRRGKYLLLEMDNKNKLIIHLRMTGRLCYVTNGQEKDAYTRIIFYLDNGDMLVYADTRTLGTLYTLDESEMWRIAGLANMGPEPLSAEFTVEYLQATLHKSKGKVKSFLLNQKYIGGLGNIYVDEALHLAGIHPACICCNIKPIAIENLHAAINKVIGDGIADGGTTFRDYRNGNGGKGSHQEKLFVYGRTGQACRNCGSLIEKTEIGGRGTHFCPKCQSEDRYK